ncbi:Nucleosomal histone H3-Lys79 methylase [Schaereria dolodes]|nr:Nucleosomal histone H3-Lys79 methylase [Schaereria dolodes]
MGFFDHFQKKGSNPIKPQPLQLRKEIIPHNAPASRQPVPLKSQRPNGHAPPRKVGRQDAPQHAKTLKAPSNHSRKRASPVEQRIESSSEDSEDEVSVVMARKKTKPNSSVEPDLKRQVRSKKAFSKDDDGVFTMVHAADIASLESSVKFIPLFDELPERAEVGFQYPSASQRERQVMECRFVFYQANIVYRYYLVKPQHGNDDFEALEDMIQVMYKVAEHYLPQAERESFTNESTGFPQRLGRAIKRHSEPDVRAVIQEWNHSLVRLLDDGTIPRVLDEYKSLDPKLVERILTQTYSRTVSPRVSSLREYENGTDNVYGELLPKFVSDILKKDAAMKSDQVFVDLGSGVGNVVLQAALEIGCESWGCEMMKNASDLAELQQDEFQARCRLWGLAVGDIHLERGDFLTNPAIGKVLTRADVVLVNNQAFTPELNDHLTSLFLDLKEGCRIVSLKSFVPAGHKITARNLNSSYNVLQVEQREYYSGCVSWTNAPGTYYISRKDTTKIKYFAERHK